MIKIKRIYDSPADDDGYRILVDRVWPRGMKKEEAKVDRWMRDIAPSKELRKWFAHDPDKWPAFYKKYREELMTKMEFIEELQQREQEYGQVTLLFAAKNREQNNAIVLRDFLQGNNEYLGS